MVVRIRHILIILVFCTVSACVVVKPWQRQSLAKATMTEDQAKGERRFEQHQQSAREGASGGSGEAAGGCGCN